MAGYVFAILPYEFKAPSGAAQGWQVTAALAALAAVAVLGGVGVLAAAPARPPGVRPVPPAGGWRQIRRRVAWAAGATAAAGGGLAALVQVLGSLTYDQLSGSGVFFLGAFGTGLLLTAAFGLWANAAKATAKHLDLAVRVRSDESAAGRGDLDRCLGDAALHLLRDRGDSVLAFRAAAGGRRASHAECRRDHQDQAGPAPGRRLRARAARGR